MSSEKDIQIPFLPGNVFRDVGKTDFRKPHSLDYQNGYAVRNAPLVGIGMEPITVNQELHQASAEQLLEALSHSPALTYGEKQFHAKPVVPRFVPAYVALDKMVLRFDAYFKETVHESIEQYHLRKVRILYYLEDDSIAVVEPPVENSGIPQRNFIKRQRLPKDTSLGSQEYYTVRDFNLGINVSFYGRTFRIVSCDQFTEKYMQETENIKLNPSETVPSDPYIEGRSRPRRDNTVPSICPTPKHNDKLKKFLDFDRNVLRFFCVWDDRGSMFGELREFVIHYYLVDDSLEVREVAKPNNGRDPFPILLRKQQLPKSLDADESDKYTWRDLRMGSVINVLGRPILIRDCDEYTREYYRDNLNLSEQELAPVPFELEDGPLSHKSVQHETPPYNGYGSIEDSLNSCRLLVLKPPKKDFIKMLENEHKVLRFVARMESKHKEDKDRRFVISYRLADDMMTIYEPPQRNAGVLGGKFMERTRVLKPSSISSLSSVSPLGSTKEPEYYNACDLYIGAKLEIFSHKFLLIDADEYVFNHMEERAKEFKLSDKARVVEVAKECARSSLGGVGRSQLEDKLVALDREGSGSLDRPAAVAALKSSWGEKLNEHELITLCRVFEDAKKGRKVEYKKLVAALA